MSIFNKKVRYLIYYTSKCNYLGDENRNIFLSPSCILIKNFYYVFIMNIRVNDISDINYEGDLLYVYDK